MIKNLLNLSILTINSLVIVWGIINFDSYRISIEQTLDVSQNKYFNRQLLCLPLFILFNFGSFVNCITEIGREKKYNLFLILNFIFFSLLGILSLLIYNQCNNECKKYLENYKLKKAKFLFKYNPYIHFLLSFEYLIFLLLNTKKKRNDNKTNLILNNTTRRVTL